MFANVPAKINFDTLDAKTAIELIQAKEEKEAKKYISNWEEEKISVQNGRWGPIMVYGKKWVNFPKDADGKRISVEAAGEYSLDQVKGLIEASDPTAFKKKGKATKATKSGESKPKAAKITKQPAKTGAKKIITVIKKSGKAKV